MTLPSPAGLATTIKGLGIIPVVVIDDPDAALPLAAALVEGGLPCAEITLRTSGALDALGIIAREYPEMLVGAGTVLNRSQAQQAHESGAQFIVSPGFSGPVVEYCQENGIAVFPGASTPTEIMTALDAGITVLKFFPAEAMGGVAILRAVSAVFGQVEFMPTGGISSRNLADYLSVPGVIACGGSWMVSSPWIRDGKFNQIAQAARDARALVTSHRSGSRP